MTNLKKPREKNRLERWERGDISTEHTIWCACNHAPEKLAHVRASYANGKTECDQHWQMSDRRPAEKARLAGWIYTRSFGWLCPPCGKRYLALKVGNMVR